MIFSRERHSRFKSKLYNNFVSWASVTIVPWTAVPKIITKLLKKYLILLMAELFLEI